MQRYALIGGKRDEQEDAILFGNKYKVVFGAVVLVCAGAIGFMILDRTGNSNAKDATADLSGRIAAGKIVYGDQCAVCHGVNLEGQDNWRARKADGRLPAPPHDPSGHTWHHPDAVLFAVTKHGLQAMAGPGYQSDMPAYADILTDQEIMDVLSYIKSTWPEDIRREQLRRTLASQQNASEGFL